VSDGRERRRHTLAISITTRTERDMVVARLADSFTNISQPISGKRAEHEWKWVCSGKHRQSVELEGGGEGGTNELEVRDLRSSRVVHEPPSIYPHLSSAVITG
jgi:hypothetical protein